MAENTPIPVTTFARKVRRVFGLDLHSWEQVMIWSLGFAALAAIAVVVSTAWVVVLQRDETTRATAELEAYKIEAGKEANEAHKRIVELQTESEKARAAIAGADERAKVAEQRAAEANLEIERLKTPRSISAEQQHRIADKLKTVASPPFSFVVMQEPDPLALMGEITATLTEAGWKRVPYLLTSGGMTYGDENTPSYGSIASLTGLVVSFPEARQAEWEPPASTLSELRTSESGIDATAEVMPSAVATGNDAVVIWIGRKP
jgi:hypothetical protein